VTDPRSLDDDKFIEWWAHPSDETLAPWRAIRTLVDWGNVVADWIEGKTAWHPTYIAPAPEPETLDEAATLVALNRAGFVTDDSQAGLIDDAPLPWRQRNYICAWCDWDTADRLQRALLDTDLVALTIQPPEETGVGDVSIGVTYGATASEPEPIMRTFLGRSSTGHLSHYAEISPPLADLIDACAEIHIFDPRWGRNDLLLPTLRRVVVGDART
jgi:hypothetical protein